jgi:hypothetical protein
LRRKEQRVAVEPPATVTALNLQVEELNLTLTNGAVQTVHVRAPEPAVNLNAPTNQPAAKAASA